MFSNESTELLKTQVTAWKIVRASWPKSVKASVKINFPDVYYLRLEDVKDDADDLAAEFARVLSPEAEDTKIVIYIEPKNVTIEEILSSLSLYQTKADKEVDCSDILGAEPHTLLAWLSAGGDEGGGGSCLDRIRMTYESPTSSPEEDSYGLIEFSYISPDEKLITLVEIACHVLNDSFACRKRKLKAAESGKPWAAENV